MSHALWAAYLATVLDIALPSGDVRRLEQRHALTPQEWPFSEDRVWIMTACNPRSEQLPHDVNAERHEALKVQIEDMGYTALPNVGFDPMDPTWREPGFTIPGIGESEVRDLATAWDQNAVFGWWPERWELVGVLLDGRSIGAWRWTEPGSRGYLIDT